MRKVLALKAKIGQMGGTLYRQYGEEGATAPLQPQEAEDIWLVTLKPHKLLQMHN
jgi:hypothetical protein